jgi:thiamine biosynthesis lipoprotein
MNRLVWLSLIPLFLFPGACQRQETPPLSRTTFMLDTVITLTVYDWRDETTLDRAFAEIHRLELLLSAQEADSDLARLQEAAGRAWVEIAPETSEILTLSREVWERSEGRFDVTCGPLLDLWHIRDGAGHVPSEAEFAQCLPLVGMDKLLWAENRAFLTDGGMRLDFGGIAKGYIADRVKELLIQEGVTSAVIDLGRNILLIGGKPGGADFQIGVQSPGEEGGVYGVLRVREKSIVTAGVYERYFIQDGRRYHHILDPFTGYPADTGLLSVTIVSDNSARGDALSTACLLLGAEKGQKLVEQTPDVEALFLFADGTAWQSAAFPPFTKE